MHDDERTFRSAARSPELQALLGDLDALRLSLSLDLSLAAAAVEVGSPDVASAVVDGDRAQLADFERRALQHLADAGADPAAVAPVVPARHRHRSLLTAMTPLVATAAAVLGVLAGVVPSGASQTERPSRAQTAMASYQEVTQLSFDGAEAADVARAAQRLHDELAAIVAQASSDPEAAQHALALLESEALVLDSSADRDQLSGVIAEARSLVARLRAALPAGPVRAPRLPTPAAAPADLVAPAQVPSVPAAPVPPSAQPEPSPQPSPAEPSPPPSPQPASPSPSPSDGSGGAARDGEDQVLPGADVPPS